MKEIALRIAAKYLLIAGAIFYGVGFVLGLVGASSPMMSQVRPEFMESNEAHTLAISAALRAMVPGVLCFCAGMICELLLGDYSE